MVLCFHSNCKFLSFSRISNRNSNKLVLIITIYLSDRIYIPINENNQNINKVAENNVKLYSIQTRYGLTNLVVKKMLVVVETADRSENLKFHNV